MKIRGQRVIPPKERISNLSKIDTVTGCWNWLKSFKGKGDPLREYGHLIIGSRTDNTRRSIAAHRYSYIIFKGEIPDGMFVCHNCDNPKCVNPDHLFLGTRQDNIDDREFKGRNKIMRGENAGTAKLTQKQADEIRILYASGGTSSRKLAKQFGLKDHGCILNIVKNKAYLPQPPKQ